MMNQPIYNVPNPYCGLVPEGSLRPNLLIKINGQVRPGANQFAINLQLGPRVNPRDDLALHFSPVFCHPQRVVRNSLQSLSWGVEESHGGFPFVQGRNFEVIILVEYNAYKIAINGYHFTEFAHRLPYNHVSHLTIDGDCNINSILYEMLNTGSSPHHNLNSGQPLPPYPVGPSGSSNMPPYPTTSGSYSGAPPMPPMPPMPQIPTQMGGYGGYQQQSYPQAYPSQQAYPQGMPPQNAYPSTSGGYGMPGAPPGYIQKPKKNKGLFSGSGILPAAGAVGGTILGASLLSRAVPKMFKGPKFFKHKGFKHKGFGFGGGFMGKSKGFGKFKGPKFGKFGKFKGPKW